MGPKVQKKELVLKVFCGIYILEKVKYSAVQCLHFNGVQCLQLIAVAKVLCS